MDQRLESDEDVEDILKLAIRESGPDRNLNERLHQSAGELGISDEALERAMERWALEKGARDDMRQFLRQRRRDFVQHLVTYGSISAIALAFDSFDSKMDWAPYILIFWGIGIAYHGICAIFPNSEALEKWKVDRTA